MSHMHYSNPPPKFVPRMVNLERQDYDLIHQVARNRGLGEKGFSAALRLIIREWSAIRKAYPELLVDLKPNNSIQDLEDEPDPEPFIHPPFP